MLGFEDVYCVWDTVRNAARYIRVVDKLKRYVAIHIFWSSHSGYKRNTEAKRPLHYKDITSCMHVLVRNKSGRRGLKQNKKKPNPGTKADIELKVVDSEHKLLVNKYLEG